MKTLKAIIVTMFLIVSLTACNGGGASSNDSSVNTCIWAHKIKDWQERQMDEIINGTDQPTTNMIDPGATRQEAFKALFTSLRATENIDYMLEDVDYWETGNEALTSRVMDCDGFGAAHYLIIREFQVVPDDHLRMAILQTAHDRFHMVVTMKIENNWYLIDNDSWRVLTLEEEDLIVKEFNIFRKF